MLEIIALNKDEAILIEKAGADRIELITNLDEGGLTPSIDIMKSVKEAVSIPVNVIIRPHSKSFHYTDTEIEEMVEDIRIVKEVGLNGVVFGVLDQNQNIHEEHLKILIDAANGLEITFHRAIDDAKDIIAALKTLTNYPEITSVLTSGTRNQILDNLEILKEMIKNKKHLNILIGGGLTFDNYETIKEVTENNHFHFGTAVRYHSSVNQTIDPNKLKELVKLIKK